MASSVSLKGTQVNLVGTHVGWIGFYVGSISEYAYGCRILLNANHVRLSKYTHYIKSTVLSLTRFFMQSIFTKAIEKGPYENVVGMHLYKCVINNWPATGTAFEQQVTSQARSYVGATEKTWLLYLTTQGGRHGYESGWRQGRSPAVFHSGFVTHGSFLLHSIKVLCRLPYICACAYLYLRLSIQSPGA